ncbi:RrF2 family transcriptional regulator [Streptomyces sp. NPDC050759]|uniref:RrF2 family transcriptional regulator n=1 Tax=Streptomyces sp. NPDC050759 TaxID=3365635 RepID=UPI0037B20667
MRVSAKAEYAVRAMAELAELTGEGREKVRAEDVAVRQDIPLRFLLTILGELKQHRLVVSGRGRDGGYGLARPAASISLADIIRSVDGALANVRDLRLTAVTYEGPAAPLVDVWRAVRASLRRVLEQVTLADLVAGELQRHVQELADEYLVDNRRRAHSADPGRPSAPAACEQRTEYAE